jgi:hypothetical protein
LTQAVSGAASSSGDDVDQFWKQLNGRSGAIDGASPKDRSESHAPVGPEDHRNSVEVDHNSVEGLRTMAQLQRIDWRVMLMALQLCEGPGLIILWHLLALNDGN